MKLRAVGRLDGAPWRAVAALTARELEELWESFRFRAVLIVILLLMTVSAGMNAARYRAESSARPEILARYDEELAKATVGSLADALHPAVKPPWRLAFLAEGQQRQTPNAYRQTLSAWDVPVFENRHPGDERRHETESLDWTFVIRTVLSLTAFLLGHDALCGPRQRRLLELTLAQAVERWQVLAAKLIAIWSCLALPFVCGALLSLTTLTLFGGLRLTAGELAKAALVGGLALWATVLFVAVALVVSARSREANRSLTALALIWITAVVVIPAASGLVMPLIRPLASEHDDGSGPGEAPDDAGERTAKATDEWRPPEWAHLDGYALERLSARARNQQFDFEEAERRRRVVEQLEQAELARALASVSPTQLVTEAAERLAGSGLARDRRFVEQAWAFRDVLKAHVHELDSRDPESPHIEFFSRYLSSRPVDAAAVPRFTFAEVSWSAGLRSATGALAVLAALTLVATAAAFLSFERFHVRGAP